MLKINLIFVAQTLEQGSVGKLIFRDRYCIKGS